MPIRRQIKSHRQKFCMCLTFWVSTVTGSLPSIWKENQEVNMLLDDPLGLATREVDGAELEDAAHKCRVALPFFLQQCSKTSIMKYPFGTMSFSNSGRSCGFTFPESSTLALVVYIRWATEKRFLELEVFRHKSYRTTKPSNFPKSTGPKFFE